MESDDLLDRSDQHGVVALSLEPAEVAKEELGNARTCSNRLRTGSTVEVAQHAASTGSATVQTMREPSGPSRRTFRSFCHPNWGSRSLQATEDFLLLAEKLGDVNLLAVRQQAEAR